jgi:hypothetical protein
MYRIAKKRPSEGAIMALSSGERKKEKTKI